MSTERPFAKLIPGFDFLQGLAGQAGKGLGSMGQWVAPTLDPKELDKRIEELKTVQFWLEQNAKLLGATIQALEVQKMTLATLQGMNLRMPDLQDVLRAVSPGQKTGAEAASASAASTANSAPAADPAPSTKARAGRKTQGRTAGRSAASAGPVDGSDAAAPVVDPVKWWGALTEQFSQIAAQAVGQSPASGMMGQVAKAAGAAAVKQMASGLGETLPKAMAQTVAKTVAQTVGQGATKAAQGAKAVTRKAGSTGARRTSRGTKGT